MLSFAGDVPHFKGVLSMVTSVKELVRHTFLPQEWSAMEVAVREGSHPALDNPRLSEAFKALFFAPVEIRCAAGAMDAFAVERYNLMGGRAGQEPSLVLIQPDRQGTLQVSFPHALSELTEFLHNGLDFGSPASVLQSSFDIDLQELAVLFAVADALKTQQLKSLLQRRPFAGVPVTFEELGEVVHAGLQVQDCRWWVTAGSILSPYPLTMDAVTARSAIERLCARRLLANNGAGFFPEGCADFVNSLLMPRSAACLSFRKAGSEGGRSDTVMAIRTSSFFWTLNYGVHGEGPTVHVAACQALSFLNQLDELYGSYFKAAGKPKTTGIDLRAASGIDLCAAALRYEAEAPPAERIEILPSKMVEFADVLARLKDSGLISQQQYKALHISFQAGDESGRVWTVNLKTSEWYEKKSGKWVKSAAPEKLFIDEKINDSLLEYASRLRKRTTRTVKKQTTSMKKKP
jgi:hypothetical protein